MITAVSIELFKVFNRTRAYIGFAAVLVLVVLLLTVFHSEGQTMFGFVAQNLEDTFTLQGNPLNGNLYAYIVLKSLWVHFPILIALVTGDLISGERQSGTLRLVLTRPITRTQLITAKFITGIIYVGALVAFMAILSIALGYLIFGTGDLLVIMDTLNIFAEDDTLWRFIYAYGFGILSMATVASLAIFMSAITPNSVTAILGTIAILIVLNFIATFSVPVFEAIDPFLFTSYMNSWTLFFDYELSMPTILLHAGILVFHIVLFFVATLLYFNKKDITS